MKRHLPSPAGFCFLMMMGCATSQDDLSAEQRASAVESVDVTAMASQADIVSEDAFHDADGVPTSPEDTSSARQVSDAMEQNDPNLWHDDCPLDQREQRLIDVGEVTLNVACRGAGPTVVFLHGFPEFHFSWNKVMNELVGEFRLIAPDQRGYNLSDKPEDVSAYEVPHLTQDILSLLPLVSPDPVILVAHDWGGPVGWMVAHSPDAHLRAFVATNGPHPMRFAELLATDPAQQQASSYMTFFRLPGSEDFFTEEQLVGQFEGVLSEDELEVYKPAWAQPGAIVGGLNWYRANDLSPESIEALAADYAPMVTVPTVVMWGLDDTAVLASNAEGLEPYVSDLTVETYPGVDHWIEHRIPEEIARVIRELNTKTRVSNP